MYLMKFVSKAAKHDFFPFNNFYLQAMLGLGAINKQDLFTQILKHS